MNERCVMKKRRILLQRAKELRREMTFEERKLWYQYLTGYSPRFQRQKVVEGFIVDFYCHSKKLVLEIDGGQHYSEEGLAYDNERTRVLESHGSTVVRFTNADVNHQFEAVCERINTLCDSLRHFVPAPSRREL